MQVKRQRLLRNKTYAFDSFEFINSFFIAILSLHVDELHPCVGFPYQIKAPEIQV